LRHGSLFNGIGGFQLAAHWMGWENVWHCEIDKFCNKVVKQHFPKSICYENIKEFDARQWKGSIEIISGGFPCQPFSQAGKRKGTSDNRYLWPEMLRVIREIQPRFIVGENVSGLINWDGGMVFEQVQADLETAGYESQAYVLPACSVNAPHRRDRVWFIARNNNCQRRNKRQECEVFNGGQGANAARNNSVAGANEKIWTVTNTSLQRERSGADEQRENETGGQQLERTEQRCHGNDNGFSGIVADTKEWRLPERDAEQTQHGTYAAAERYDGIPGWRDFPTQSAVCRRDDGIPDRVDRIKALGNAIVPQVAYQIFKAIEATTQTKKAPVPGAI
jgi:DNA (cytosine-5)-methyltransferase 1